MRLNYRLKLWIEIFERDNNMVRLFNRNIKRKTYLLDGLWKFKIDPQKRGIDEKWFQQFPQDSVDMIIPSCWNTEMGFFDYEGVAWYSTEFSTVKDHINLIFHGVTGYCEVYLDGTKIGCHYGGWTGFNLLVKNLKQGQHTLILSVDNTHDDMNTLPLSKVDWFHYGGIIRDVEVQELCDLWIKDYHISYELDNDLHTATLQVKVVLENLTKETHHQTLRIDVGDTRIYSKLLAVQSEVTVEIEAVTLHPVKAWNIHDPNLYYVKFELDTDDIIDRIGFRTITRSDKQILINGKETFLKGVNRHEEHPEWGFSVPIKLMKRDIDIIKQMGGNAIRGSHYPSSPAFLDYLDQEGLVFWEEIPLWQYYDKHFQNPIVVSRAQSMLEEMVQRDLHHPSIILWGIHNEVDTTSPLCYEMTKSLVDTVRSLDNSRLLLYASSRPLVDICFDLVDVVGVNKYLGWYEGTPEDWIPFLRELKQKLKKDGLGHMPIFISEFGAGGIHGDITFEGPKWTENYQEQLLEFTITLFGNDPDIAGAFIWQFCDIRSSKELELARPRSFNNKGILNEYRKPKLAYWTVKKLYTAMK